MNTDNVFEAFGDVDSDYVEKAAATMRRAKQRRRNRSRLTRILAAACFLLVLSAITASLMIAKFNTRDIPISTPKPTEKLSITTIPGAMPFDKQDAFLSDHPAQFTAFPIDPNKWVASIKAQNAAVIGTASNYTSVLIKDGEAYYHVFTVTIEISNRIYKADDLDNTVKAVYVCQYQPDFYGHFVVTSPYVPVKGFPCYQDMGIMTIHVPYGLYLLESSEGHELSLNGQTISLSDYADYYMSAHLAYDESVQNVRLGRYGVFDLKLLCEYPPVFDSEKNFNQTIAPSTSTIRPETPMTTSVTILPEASPSIAD